MRNIFCIIGLIVCFGIKGYAQQQECTSKHVTDCAYALDKFSLAKTIDIKPSMYRYGGEQLEFSYFFSKGSTYVIAVCDDNGEGNKLIVDVYDKNKRLVTRNYDANNKKYYNKIYFPCSATGVYYLKYSFSGSRPTCGASTVGVQNYIVKKVK